MRGGGLALDGNQGVSFLADGFSENHGDRMNNKQV